MTVVIPSENSRASLVVGSNDVGHTVAVGIYVDPARTLPVEGYPMVNMPGIFYGHANITIHQCDFDVPFDSGFLYGRVWIMATAALHE